MCFLKNKNRFKKYKEFREEQAKGWAKEHYRNIVVEENVRRIIATYCKEDNPELNIELRANDTANKLTREIQILNNFLLNNTVQDDIVVYRLVDFNPFKNSKKFGEKGFMSTSLVNGDINFIHNHQTIDGNNSADKFMV